MKLSKNEIKKIVKESYAQTALSGNSCCDLTGFTSISDLGRKLDYSEEDMAGGPGDANLGLGCGNPVAEADLKLGETVVDLGCGAGFDAFLSAKKVGTAGKVIGIDMTPEMINIAKKNTEKTESDNVDFRLGEIEHLPVPDNTADVVMSNCVINLSPDKNAVYKEMFRVLKPGGRISIYDIVRCGEIPLDIKNNPAAYTG
jgi:SAM-dependent methyltransferase